MNTLTAQPRGYRLAVGDLAALQVSVVRAPAFSLVTLWQCRRSGHASGRAGQALRGAVSGRSRYTAAAVWQPGPQFVPDVVLNPIPRSCDVPMVEHTQGLLALSESALPAELAANFGLEVPPLWREAADRPRRWLDAYASALMDCWQLLDGPWRAHQPLFQREVRRVGSAVVRGGLDVLLNSLHPRIRYRHGEVVISAAAETSWQLDGRRLVLVPMLSGPNGTVAAFDQPGVAYLAYPLPGAWGERTRQPDRSGTVDDPLALLIGETRARLLRIVREPQRVGDLGAELCCQPATVSYHCHHLEGAGLVERERVGQSVWVRATMRGWELGELFSSPTHT